MKQILQTTITFTIFLLIFGNLKAQTVDMTVQQGPNVDVMVTVGSADLDLSTFETDLEQAMYAKGIPLGKLRVEAFQRSFFYKRFVDQVNLFLKSAGLHCEQIFIFSEI